MIVRNLFVCFFIAGFFALQFLLYLDPGSRLGYLQRNPNQLTDQEARPIWRWMTLRKEPGLWPRLNVWTLSIRQLIVMRNYHQGRPTGCENFAYPAVTRAWITVAPTFKSGCGSTWKTSPKADYDVTNHHRRSMILLDRYDSIGNGLGCFYCDRYFCWCYFCFSLLCCGGITKRIDGNYATDRPLLELTTIVSSQLSREDQCRRSGASTK